MMQAKSRRQVTCALIVTLAFALLLVQAVENVERTI